MSGKTALTGVSVTTSDTNDNKYDALWIGIAGDVAVVPRSGNAAVTFKNVPIGWFSVSVDKVMSTNTTASEIIGVTW